MKFSVLVLLAVYVSQCNSGLPLSRIVPDSENPGLYDSNDKVVVLTGRNLNQEIMGRNYSTLLEFYNSFCGHCRRFAPKYKQLASDLYPWRDVLRVAALDCATDENNDACRQYEIMGYPSLRYFGPNSVNGDGNLGKPIETQDLEMITDLITRLLMEQTPMPPDWPTFTNLIEHDMDYVFHREPPSVKYIAVIYEAENSTAAAQAILHFHSIKELRIRRTTDAKIAQQLHLNNNQSIMVFKRDGSSSKLNLRDVSIAALKFTIESYLYDEKVIFHTESPPVGNAAIAAAAAVASDETILEQVLKNPRHIVYQSDIENALRYTLFHEIPAISEITGQRLLALQQYLGALNRYNPLGENGRRFVDELRKYAYSHSKGLQGNDFKAQAMQLEAQHRPVFSSNRWVGCRPSKPGYRGYTCGLWTLFHSMIVQASEDETAADPLEVLQAMHGYVKFYFGCTDCSRHFQEMASRRNIWNTPSKDEAILWLWAAHNEVNQRLAGDETEDPAFPKVQFPTKDSCPSCYRDQLSPSIAGNAGDVQWNKNEVLAFLKRIHNPQNISRFGIIEESALSETINKMRSKRMITNVFSDIDMRMGIFLYVFCIGMMFLAVKLFLRKGYRKKPYAHALFGKV